MRLLFLAVAILRGGIAPAHAAYLPAELTSQAQHDTQRFGRRRPLSQMSRHRAQAEQAFTNFKQSHGQAWQMRVNENTGHPAALVHGRTMPRRGAPEAISSSFLAEAQSLMRIDPSSLVQEVTRKGLGMTHLLYRQTYKGLPVEFSRVKVHVADDGAVVGVGSNYEPDLALDTTPGLAAEQAAQAVGADCGKSPSDRGSLVILPDQGAGSARLAWKFKVRMKAALWRYYVDAQNGKVLFRYNDLKFATAGTVTGTVYDKDPNAPAAQRAFANAYVYVATPDNASVTDANGAFANGQSGKIVTALQGPWVTVANFLGPSAHYDNGSGVWQTQTYAASSPHPYSTDSVFISTIDISALQPDAFMQLPVFSNFNVGTYANGDFTQDDEVTIFDANLNPLASYIGNRGPFNGTAAYGQTLYLHLRPSSAVNVVTNLRGRTGSNSLGAAISPSTSMYGYDVASSSYLIISNPTVPGVSADHEWTSTDTALSLRSELSLFYHLNKMHDYYLGDVDKSSAAFLGAPANAMAFLPDLDNAFFDSTDNNLFFGDGGDQTHPTDKLTDDATIIRHEYTHYMMDKIWPITYFGQSGSISEGTPDYFSGSSLGTSSIGKYYNGGTPLRELDCEGNPGACRVLNGANWEGDLYKDGLAYSQSLWYIRSHTTASCADNLAFQTLLFFPESFQEIVDDMQTVARNGMAPPCAPIPSLASIITNGFSLHGIGVPGGDVWEKQSGSLHNDGFEAAVDVSTIPSLSATIYPSGDVDYYTFGAGAGPMQFILTLPQDPGSLYDKAYMMTLYDRNHTSVAQAQPPYDGPGGLGSVCSAGDCDTSAQQVVLTYTNATPGPFFLEINGGQTAAGSNSAVSLDTVPYTVSFVFPKAAAFPGSIITASYDNDQFSFAVAVSCFARTTGPGAPGGQDYSFAYAQLRDHAFNAISQTDTRNPTYLTVLSSTNLNGSVSGSLALQPGFAQTFPAFGTVYLEVFGYDVAGSSVSLGLSPPLSLTSNQASLHAYNNIFNPLRGEKATIKYATSSSGHVRLTLYTLDGRLVKALVDEDLPPGRGSLDWEGDNLRGSTVASGVYLLRLVAPGFSKTQKIVVVK